MLRLIFPAILLLFIYSCSNAKEPAPPSTQLVLGSLINNLDSPEVIYYPYYDGIQMIEIDYLSPWLINRRIEASRYSIMPPTSSDPILLYPRPRKNIFILRDKQDKIIAHYHISEAELETITFIQTADSIPMKTIFHKQKSSALLVEQFSTYSNTSKEGNPVFRYHIQSKKGLGIIDTFGAQLLEPVYQGIALVNSYYYLTKDNKVELTDINFNTIIPAKYAYLSPFCNGIYVFKKDNLYGFIDSTGKEIIKPKYHSTPSPFNYGFFQVFTNKRGLIDSSAKEICPPIYDKIYFFEDNLAQVYRDKKWGYINANGVEIIECIYKKVNSFRNGMAKVSLGGIQWGYIDSTGKTRIKPIYSYLGPIDNNQCVAYKNALYKNKKGETHYASKCGLIDSEGNILIPFQYHCITTFRDSLCAACKHKNGIMHCGFINKNNQVIIPFKFSYKGNVIGLASAADKWRNSNKFKRYLNKKKIESKH